MAGTTAHYAWPYIATNQSSPEITHNEALDDIDAQVFIPASSVAPPTTHTSAGTKGNLALGNDGGSPPIPCLFVCYATNSWARIKLDGTGMSLTF